MDHDRPLHHERFGADGEPCERCGAPLAADQRYCLHCGARRAEPRVAWAQLLGGDGRPAEVAIDPPPPPFVAPPSLPSPRVAALLCLAMLTGGIALGAAAGPRTQDTLAAGGRTIVVQTPAAAPPATPPPATDTTPPAMPTPAPATPVTPVTPVTPEPTTSTPTTESSPTTDSGSDDSGATDDSTDTGDDDDGGTTDESTTTAASSLPPVKHVWLIVLSDHGYWRTFGVGGDGSQAPYLSGELRPQGVLLRHVRALAHGGVATGVALLSGQLPAADAPAVYPATVATLADQLAGAGKTWRAYVGDGSTCQTPAEGSTSRNPFIRFRSILEAAECGTNVVGLDRLQPDLDVADQTPSFSYLLPAIPDLPAADAWLRDAIGRITATQAYKDDGLVIVTFDDAPGDDRGGGGAVGALLLSPFVTPGATIARAYDHVSLLRSIEDLFGLEHLGAADDPAHPPFGPKVYGAFK